MAYCAHCLRRSDERHWSWCPTFPENRMLASRTEVAAANYPAPSVQQVDQRAGGEVRDVYDHEAGRILPVVVGKGAELDLR